MRYTIITLTDETVFYADLNAEIEWWLKDNFIFFDNFPGYTKKFIPEKNVWDKQWVMV